MPFSGTVMRTPPGSSRSTNPPSSGKLARARLTSSDADRCGGGIRSPHSQEIPSSEGCNEADCEYASSVCETTASKRKSTPPGRLSNVGVTGRSRLLTETGKYVETSPSLAEQEIREMLREMSPNP